MAKFLKLIFSGDHSYYWNGIISNQKIESEEEKKTKISLIQVNEITDFPTEAIDGMVMFGGFQLRCLQWGISINPSNFVNTVDLKIQIKDSCLTISGSLIIKINLKPECLIDFEKNTDKIFIDEVSLWNVESYFARNPYNFTITGNWNKDNKINDSIKNGTPLTDRTLKIESFNKMPK
jgi:hypothetical protein